MDVGACDVIACRWVKTHPKVRVTSEILESLKLWGMIEGVELDVAHSAEEI